MTRHHVQRAPAAAHDYGPEQWPEAETGPGLSDPSPPGGDPSQVPGARAGRWERKPGRGWRATDDPLSWQPELTVWERIRAQISVPKAAAVVVFLIALFVTAAVLLRSLGDPAMPEDSPGSLGPAAPKLEASKSGAPAGTDAAAGIPDSSPRGTAATKIFVHVVGEVERPGVVELETGARVLDAIAAAGGATPQAELSAVNLARTVTDGEQIVVLDAEAAAQLPAGSAQGNAPGASGGGPGGSAGGGINVNSASVDELTELPGIGPALGQRIVDWREANGPFTSVEQLTEVSGIGAKTLEKFRERVIL